MANLAKDVLRNKVLPGNPRSWNIDLQSCEYHVRDGLRMFEILEAMFELEIRLHVTPNFSRNPNFTYIVLSIVPHF